MAKPTIVGIDPSIRKTGVAWSNGSDPQTRLFTSVNDTDSSVVRRMARYEEVVFRINQFLQRIQPAVIVIEGYSFGSPNRAHPLAEFGGLLRWHLLEHTSRVYECSPSSLKRFVTGKGSGNKAVVQAYVQKRWNRIFESDDEADAYGLCRIGMAAMGYDAVPKFQLDELGKVFGDDVSFLPELGGSQSPAF